MAHKVFIQTIVAVIFVGMGCLIAPTANATINCTSTQYITVPNSGTGSTYNAADNYTTSGTNTCIVFTGGTLNMNSKSVTCTSPSGCGTAIQINDNTAQSATVKSANISGPFWADIDDETSTYPLKITNNTITGGLSGYTTEIFGGGQISGNVIVSTCDYFWAIQWYIRSGGHFTAANQFIQNNFFDCSSAASIGIGILGGGSLTSAVNIQNNIFRVGNVGIYWGSYGTNPVKISENTIFGNTAGTPYVASPVVSEFSFSKNLCDQSVYALQSTACQPAAAPFPGFSPF